MYEMVILTSRFGDFEFSRTFALQIVREIQIKNSPNVKKVREIQIEIPQMSKKCGKIQIPDYCSEFHRFLHFFVL